MRARLGARIGLQVWILTANAPAVRDNTNVARATILGDMASASVSSCCKSGSCSDEQKYRHYDFP